MDTLPLAVGEKLVLRKIRRQLDLTKESSVEVSFTASFKQSSKQTDLVDSGNNVVISSLGFELLQSLDGEVPGEETEMTRRSQPDVSDKERRYSEVNEKSSRDTNRLQLLSLLEDRRHLLPSSVEVGLRSVGSWVSCDEEERGNENSRPAGRPETGGGQMRADEPLESQVWGQWMRYESR